MYITISIFVILFLIVTLLVRIFFAKNVFETFQIINSTQTLFVLLIMLFCFFKDMQEFIDLALIYVIISYAGVVAFLKFIKEKEKAKN